MNQLEKNHTYLGFTDNKSPLQKANIETCLDRKVRYTEGIMTRKDSMLCFLRQERQPEVVTTDKGKKSYTCLLVSKIRLHFVYWKNIIL